MFNPNNKGKGMNREESHLEKKLSSFFDSVFWYSALAMGDVDPSDLPRLTWALGCCEAVEEVIEKYKQTAHNRDLLVPHPGLMDTLTELEYPLSELKKYLNSPSNSKLNEKDARIFWHYIYHCLKELEGMSQEVDYELSSKKPKNTQ